MHAEISTDHIVKHVTMLLLFSFFFSRGAEKKKPPKKATGLFARTLELDAADGVNKYYALNLHLYSPEDTAVCRQA